MVSERQDVRSVQSVVGSNPTQGSYSFPLGVVLGVVGLFVFALL